MYSRQVLEEHGFKSDEIKPLAENLDSNRESKFAKWVEREAARIRSGVDYNLKNWRLWWALDQAMDAPFHQISYTLVRDILNKDYDDEKVKSLIEDFGVAHMLEPVLSSDGTVEKTADGAEKTALNIPVFFQVFVPLCMAYHKARWSKLFNDRNLTPLYKYEPAYSTPDNRLRCDIWTSRISTMASQYGYSNDEKDSIFQALHYGLSIAFPREAWHREYQLDASGKKKVVREGLRFNMPPPERMYYDMSERLSTMNSQSGIGFAGYWHISKLGDIKSNEWWNKDKIAFGGDVDVISSNPNFFSNIYPCSLKFPNKLTSEDENDREKQYAAYAQAEDDTAVLLTEHFTTIVPKDVGIGTYEYPINVRMVMMNYDTVAYIEPLFCGFGAYYGYDADGNRAKNSSLTLEVLPFQDHISNIISQWILSAKKNLMSAVFVDTNIVPKTAVDALKNEGEKVLRGVPFIEFNSRDMQAALGEKREAFYSPKFPVLPTSEMQQLIRGLLDLLERALQFSPQEIGQAASHEQSATESNIIHNNIGNRVQFTGTFIDDGIWAKKKMLYEASVANIDDDIWAEVYPNYTATLDEFKKLCEKLKITFEDKAGNSGDRAIVKAKSDALIVDAFASPRDGANRVNNQAVATAAVQLLTAFTNNPALFQAVGPEQIVELTNQIASLLQLPKDFRLKFNAESYVEAQQGAQNPEMMNQIQEGMKNMAEEINKRIEQGEKGAMEAMQEGDQKVAESIAGEVGPVLQQAGEKMQQLEQALGDMGKAIQQLAQNQQGLEQAMQVPQLQ